MFYVQFKEILGYVKLVSIAGVGQRELVVEALFPSSVI